MTANAQLYDRGNGMIYDSDQDITWLQDASYAKTSGYDDDGLMSNGEATRWAENLVYGGYDDWRLPNGLTTNCGFSVYFPTPECGYSPDTSTSELAYMWYDILGNKALCDNSNNCDQPGGGLTSTSADGISFTNIQPTRYWMQNVNYSLWSWFVGMDSGQHSYNSNYFPYGAWAVRDGDVTPSTPVPSDNVAPTANAGTDLSVTVGDQVCLTGNGSDDDGDLLTYSWQFTSTPLNSIALFSSTYIAAPCFTADEAGVFVAELTVNDGLINSAPSAVTITVGSSDGGSGGGSTCTALQTQLDDALFQIDQLNIEIVDLNLQLVTQTTVINDLTQERDLLQQEVNTLTSENSALNQQVIDLTTENAVLTQQVNDLTLQVTELQSQVSDLTSENTALTQENSDLQSQVNEVTSQINLLDATFGGAIPGATPEEQLANLVAAIQNLNNGRLTGLLKDLGFK